MENQIRVRSLRGQGTAREEICAKFGRSKESEKRQKQRRVEKRYLNHFAFFAFSLFSLDLILFPIKWTPLSLLIIC